MRVTKDSWTVDDIFKMEDIWTASKELCGIIESWRIYKRQLMNHEGLLTYGQYLKGKLNNYEWLLNYGRCVKEKSGILNYAKTGGRKVKSYERIVSYGR